MWFSTTNSQEQRLLLILQSDQAYWVRVKGRQIVDQFSETILEGPARLPTRCPWVKTDNGAEPIDVTLVLDTTMDEVDRVSVPQTGSVLINRYRQLTTVTRLRADYPQAHAYALPHGYNDQIAALMHPDMSEQWSSWLLFMQSANVVFRKVVTASELAANWSREQFVAPALLVMDVAGLQRHLLVDRGRILFLRTAHMGNVNGMDSLASGTASESAVAHSMEHLSEVIPNSKRRVRVVCDFRIAERCVEEDAVLCGASQNDDQNALENQYQELPVPTCLPDSVVLLVAMLEEWVIDYNELSLSDQNLSAAHHANAEPVLTSDSIINRAWFSRTLDVFKIINALPAHQRQRQWSLLRPGVSQMVALLPSVKHEKMCARISIMFRLSVLMASLALVGATAALANGIMSARLMGQQQLQRVSIEQAVVSAYDAALVSHVQPRVAAESLIIADLLTHSATATPEKILSGVATAVNAVPGISIDGIVWAVVEADDAYESLTHALAAVPSIRSVESRSDEWAVQVELAGRVAGDTLVMRKALLDTFLVELGELRGASDVVVLESPVDLALSSSTDRRRADQYRLTLKFGDT